MWFVSPQMCRRGIAPASFAAANSRCSYGRTNCRYCRGETSEPIESPRPMTCAPAATCARTNAIADLDEALEELRQPLRPVVDVEQHVRVAAQNGGERERALDPAHHRHVVADPLAQQAYRLEAVAHAPAVLGGDEAQPGRVLGRLQQDRPAQRQPVVGPLDVEAEVGRLAVRVGDRLHDVEVERLEHGEVRLHERAVVEVVVAQPAAGVVRRRAACRCRSWAAGRPARRAAAAAPARGASCRGGYSGRRGRRAIASRRRLAQSTRAVSCIRAKRVRTAPIGDREARCSPRRRRRS